MPQMPETGTRKGGDQIMRWWFFCGIVACVLAVLALGSVRSAWSQSTCGPNVIDVPIEIRPNISMGPSTTYSAPQPSGRCQPGISSWGSSWGSSHGSSSHIEINRGPSIIQKIRLCMLAKRLSRVAGRADRRSGRTIIDITETASTCSPGSRVQSYSTSPATTAAPPASGPAGSQAVPPPPE